MAKINQSPHPGTLTDREHEILLLICKGHSNQKIAEKLYLTHGTIKWYCSQIYSKLGVKNRTGAMAQAQQLGLLKSTAEAEDKILRFAVNRRQPVQRIHFTTSFDGTQIAYAVAGEGPPFIKTAAYMSHLEYDWNSRIFGHWLAAFCHHHTLIRYDERGTGLSDWDVEDFSFEAWVHDLEAVVHATGAERFPLFAQSQGGTVAIAYAARYPEKVSHLILFGAYARGWLNRDLTPEQMEEERTLMSLMKIGWGRDNPAFRQVFATQIIPDGPPELIRELEKLMRVSTTAENAVRLETTMHHTDVRELAQTIKVPTLICHPTGDLGIPFEEGRILASLIPDAQFVPLDSRNHLLRDDEPAWTKFVEALRRFLRD